jgi:Domain of unknown function (DUF6434)
MSTIGWHLSPLTRETPVNKDYRATYYVRRFLAAQCGYSSRPVVCGLDTQRRAADIERHCR